MKRVMRKDWPEGQRPCYKCGTFKPLGEFGRHSACAGGINSKCRACIKVKSKLDLSRQSQEYKIFHRAKTRAKKEALPFNIELLDIVIPKLCPVLGRELVVGDPDWTPSIDKLIPVLGYTKGNVRIICNRANRLKNDASLDELERIVAYMKESM